MIPITMNSKVFLFGCLVFIFSISLCSSFSQPILSHIDPNLRVSNPVIPNTFEKKYFTQTLDHFNYNPESYATFWQRYYISSEYWAGPNSSAPIFVFLGAESPINDVHDGGGGILQENAPHFRALQVYIEHRFYGESNPVGTMDQALQDNNIRGYFNSAQALADYAKILLHIKKLYSAEKSPIIVFGGSYGGMLAAWFRLKYPHVALGALASSAPVRNFDSLVPQDTYASVITKDFKDESQNCYETIKSSWDEINRVASEPDGLSTLSSKFQICEHLTEASPLIRYLESIYPGAAQYDAPPNYPVKQICKAIDGAPMGADILDKIALGVLAYNHLYNQDDKCLDLGGNQIGRQTTSGGSQTALGWAWQRCTEMGTPMGVTRNDSMFQVAPDSLSNLINFCQQQFGITPRPHWAITYYGGQDMKLVFGNFASNIIFSNGLKDPYSASGVLEDLSDSLLAVYTKQGSHCLDILPSRADDPEWLTNQRKQEIRIIRGWITKYNQDLRELQK